MRCPDDIADILLQIIQDGIVSARWAGWRKNPEWAAIEASHVHNLLEVIRKYGPEKLVYYWDSERDSYIEQFTRLLGKEPKMFVKSWEVLEPLVAQVRSNLPSTSSYHAKIEEILHTFAEE